MPPPVENDRLADKKPERADAQAAVGESGKNAPDTSTDDQPSPNQTTSANQKNHKWRGYVKTFFYDTNVTDWLLAIFTLLLVVYTAQLVGVASRQTKILSTTDTALNKAATAANNANSLSRAIQRAFVVLEEIRQDQQSDQSGTPLFVAFAPIIQNSGATTATAVSYVATSSRWDWLYLPPDANIDKYHQCAFSLKSPMDPDYILTGQDRKSEITENVYIGPHVSISPLSGIVSVRWDVTQDVNKLASEVRFMYGVIRYSDVFGEKHITKYCYSLNTLVIRFGKKQVIPELCRHWNCVDGDCAQDKAAYDQESKKPLPK